MSGQNYGGSLDLDGVESSYKEAGYGSLFYALIRTHRPRLVVELGSYLGYSGLHMAAGLRDNAPLAGALHLVDLWDSYPYRHCSMADTKAHFAKNGLLEVPHCAVRFLNADAAAACATFADGSVDFLHIDISNDGAKMAEVVPLWERKLSREPNALLVVEGGSAARDRIEWMTTYNKPPLRSWLESPWVMERFSWFTFEPFPSLTLLRRHP
jgi:predicted O-methyltransferase YrrM